MNSTNRYPGFWQAVLLCVVFVVLQGVLIAPVAIADVVFKSHWVRHPAALGIVNLIDCAAVLALARLIGRPALSEVFAFRRVSVPSVAAVIVAMPGAVILLSEVDNLMRLAVPPPEGLMGYFRELASSSGQRFWEAVFLLVLVAPVTEELLFRGLILRGFLRRFSPARACLWSALLFGASHLNPWQFMSGTALGLIFAWLYARTRSLIPCLAGHALANAAVLGHQAFWFKVRGFNAGDSLASPELQPWWFDALGVLFLAAGLWLFRISTPAIQVEPGPDTETPPLVAPPIIPPEASTSPPALPPEAPASDGASTHGGALGMTNRVCPSETSQTDP